MREALDHATKGRWSRWELERAEVMAENTRLKCFEDAQLTALRQWSEHAREAIVELVGYVDRFGQQGVRDRAHALLAAHPAATNLTEERK